jgi:hypothetical protein
VTSSNGGDLTITNAFGYTTATSLGIERTVAAGTTVTGSTVYSLGLDTALSALNDGNGIVLNSTTGTTRHDFVIKVGGTSVNINIGDMYDTTSHISEAAPTTLRGMLKRINDQLKSGLGDTDVVASIASDGVSIQVVDAQVREVEISENATAGSTTAADLGIKTAAPATGTVAGQRILAGLNTTLARAVNGGSGVSGDGSISVTTRDGTVRAVNVNTTGTLDEIIAAFSAQTGGAVVATLNRTGTGIKLTDTTGGSGNLIVSGTTATSLGIANAGVASATLSGTNLQHRYITDGTRLASLRAGQGVGTGKFRITDSTGVSALITIDETEKTLDDVIDQINSRGTRIKARINDHGDGLLLYEDPGGGANKIKVADDSGAVAAALNIAGEATGTGVQNYLDGSYEKSLTFDATDTLQTMATKITAANVGVSATVINDGTGAAPFRLSLTGKNSGSAGRFIMDTGTFDLGETTMDRGQDARVFYGSSDPARAVLLSSSRNTLDSVITGVTIDLNTVSEDPITLTINRDNEGVETAVNTFMSAFNTLVDSITSKTKYDQDTETKGSCWAIRRRSTSERPSTRPCRGARSESRGPSTSSWMSGSRSAPAASSSSTATGSARPSSRMRRESRMSSPPACWRPRPHDRSGHHRCDVRRSQRHHPVHLTGHGDTPGEPGRELHQLHHRHPHPAQQDHRYPDRAPEQADRRHGPPPGEQTHHPSAAVPPHGAGHRPAPVPAVRHHADGRLTPDQVGPPDVRSHDHERRQQPRQRLPPNQSAHRRARGTAAHAPGRRDQVRPPGARGARGQELRGQLQRDNGLA